MARHNKFDSPGGWLPKSDHDGLALRVKDFLSRHVERVPTTFVAKALGIERAAAYEALSQLHADRLVGRRPDARGRVWWFPREDLGLVRKERIVFALERAPGGEMPTAKLGRMWGEPDAARAYQVLKYYRSLGLLEAAREHPGTEAVWRLKR